MSDTDPYPLTVFKARYQGTYEGAPWIALQEYPGADVILDATSHDTACASFFRMYEHFKPIGRGGTAQDAIDDLAAKLRPPQFLL